MITIKSGKLYIPEDEHIIGFAGDNLHTKKQFFLENFSDESCTHSLYLQFCNGAVKNLVLDSKVENGSTILTWNILKEHILKSGLVKAQIKSTFESGETSHTSWDYLFVFPSAEFSEEFENIDITEFEDYTQKLNEVYEKVNHTDFDTFVTSERTIAGVSLSDNIEASVLCEALKVHPTEFKEGAPTVFDGIVGEYLIDTVNNDLYYCKNRTLSGNNWIKLTGSKESIKNIQSAQINNIGELVLTFDDDTTLTAGVVAGKNGIDGNDGYTPVKGVDYFTVEEKAEFETYIADKLAKRGQLRPEFANSVEECTDTSKLYVLPDGYIYGYIKTTTIIPAYINKVPTSIDTSGAVYNSTGYKEGYRVNSSGVEVACEGAVCSGFIPVTKGDIIRVLSDSGTPSHSAHYFDTYDESFVKVSANGGANIGSWESFEGRYLWTIDTSALSVAPAYIRCATLSNGANFIVTVNEPLDGESQKVESYNWSNTGHAFVPADYEDRIIDVENEVATLKANNSEANGVPSYVLEEAEEVSDKVLTLRNAHSFVFGAVSDTHTTGDDTSKDSIIHAGMGLDAVNNVTQLDLIANFGDVMVGYLDDTYKEGFKHIKSAFYDISKSVPYIQMQGNHDQIASDSTEEARQKYFAYIGANNMATITDWDNRFRNYGYRDFDDQRMRVIYLNTADVSERENEKDVWVTAKQYSWLINTALDFSDKANETEWSFIVCSHHPLNWYYLDNLLTILNAYKGKESGAITVDDISISYDFTNVAAELVAHFHGHLHNFRAETLGSNNVTTITIPNACFDRNNEYGTSSSYDEETRAKFGDTDENGNQRQFSKASDSAEDTAFNVVVVDRDNRKIHCINYGAGVDRDIDY